MTAIYNAFNSDETAIGRFLTTAAHLMLYGVAINAVASIAFLTGIDNYLLDVISWVAFALVVTGVFHNHLTRLCVRCMREVPADAGVRAERQRWVLWINHSLDTKRKVLVIIGIQLTLGALVKYADFPHIFNLPSAVFSTLFLYSIWLHHRLRPWCLYCRDWGDGGMREPSPDPVVKATR